MSRVGCAVRHGGTTNYGTVLAAGTGGSSDPRRPGWVAADLENGAGLTSELSEVTRSRAWRRCPGGRRRPTSADPEALGADPDSRLDQWRQKMADRGRAGGGRMYVLYVSIAGIESVSNGYELNRAGAERRRVDACGPAGVRTSVYAPAGVCTGRCGGCGSWRDRARSTRRAQITAVLPTSTRAWRDYLALKY